MPNREFLESYPLYRKFEMEVNEIMLLQQVKKPAIHMPCQVCGSEQTFNMTNQYYELAGHNKSPRGRVVRAVYSCASCGKFSRFFFLKFGPEGNYVVKVGQEPPWDISVDRTLERILGESARYYKRGLICESQGYGIGAFSYYRRIVEEIIDNLLAQIPDLMSGEELERYLEALEKVKETTIAQDKIDLVKDLLPPVLRPGGTNPLSALHSVLSEGLHQESDERCIELAATIREVLVFLVNQVTATKEAGARFTESMRRLLDRRKKSAAAQ